jgi:hypothetical protein
MGCEDFSLLSAAPARCPRRPTHRHCRPCGSGRALGRATRNSGLHVQMLKSPPIARFYEFSLRALKTPGSVQGGAAQDASAPRWAHPLCRQEHYWAEVRRRHRIEPSRWGFFRYGTPILMLRGIARPKVRRYRSFSRNKSTKGTNTNLNRIVLFPPSSRLLQCSSIASPRISPS